MESIYTLSCRLEKAKEEEKKAKEKRLEAEAALIAALPDHAFKDEGTSTTKIPDFNISVTTKLTRSLDFDAYKSLDLPPNLTFVDQKPVINMKRMRAVEMIDPTLVASCVTTKPAKTSIKLERVEVENGS